MHDWYKAYIVMSLVRIPHSTNRLKKEFDLSGQKRQPERMKSNRVKPSQIDLTRPTKPQNQPSNYRTTDHHQRFDKRRRRSKESNYIHSNCALLWTRWNPPTPPLPTERILCPTPHSMPLPTRSHYHSQVRKWNIYKEMYSYCIPLRRHRYSIFLFRLVICLMCWLIGASWVESIDRRSAGRSAIDEWEKRVWIT